MVPADTINFEACSKDTSKYIKSFFGNISRKPLVGFGVVGTKFYDQRIDTNIRVTEEISFKNYNI